MSAGASSKASPCSVKKFRKTSENKKKEQNQKAEAEYVQMPCRLTEEVITPAIISDFLKQFGRHYVSRLLILWVQKILIEENTVYNWTNATI